MKIVLVVFLAEV